MASSANPEWENQSCTTWAKRSRWGDFDQLIRVAFVGLALVVVAWAVAASASTAVAKLEAVLSFMMRELEGRSEKGVIEETMIVMVKHMK